MPSPVAVSQPVPSATSLPVVIAFETGEVLFLKAVDVITDLIFLIDVFINFHTAFVTKSGAHNRATQ